MTSPAEHSHLPSPDYNALLSSTWHVLEQPPPPTLREILAAYRSRGDGDRDMLIAMLNAKSAEDQLMAAIASLHRTLLDLYTADPNIPLPPRPYPYPLSSAHVTTSKDKRRSTDHEPSHKSAPSLRDPPMQPQPPRKRQRYSPSPVPSSHHNDARSSLPSSRDLPPSPYSSRSDSEEYSPRSRASMAIGSLLSSGVVRDSAPEDPQSNPELSKTRYPPSAIGVSV